MHGPSVWSFPVYSVPHVSTEYHIYLSLVDTSTCTWQEVAGRWRRHLATNQARMKQETPLRPWCAQQLVRLPATPWTKTVGVGAADCAQKRVALGGQDEIHY